MDVSGSVRLGNISEDSLFSIWNNSEMKKMRTGLLGLGPLKKVCVGCARV